MSSARKQKKSGLELIAIYRLEFYRKQKNWKLGREAAKKKPAQTKNVLNQTYNIEVAVTDVAACPLNNAFIESASEIYMATTTDNQNPDENEQHQRGLPPNSLTENATTKELPQDNINQKLEKSFSSEVHYLPIWSNCEESSANWLKSGRRPKNMMHWLEPPTWDERLFLPAQLQEPPDAEGCWPGQSQVWCNSQSVGQFYLAEDNQDIEIELDIAEKLRDYGLPPRAVGSPLLAHGDQWLANTTHQCAEPECLEQSIDTSSAFIRGAGLAPHSSEIAGCSCYVVTALSPPSAAAQQPPNLAPERTPDEASGYDEYPTRDVGLNRPHAACDMLLAGSFRNNVNAFALKSGVKTGLLGVNTEVDCRGVDSDHVDGDIEDGILGVQNTYRGVNVVDSLGVQNNYRGVNVGDSLGVQNTYRGVNVGDSVGVQNNYRGVNVGDSLGVQNTYRGVNVGDSVGVQNTYHGVNVVDSLGGQNTYHGVNVGDSLGVQNTYRGVNVGDSLGVGSDDIEGVIENGSLGVQNTYRGVNVGDRLGMDLGRNGVHIGVDGLGVGTHSVGANSIYNGINIGISSLRVHIGMNSDLCNVNTGTNMGMNSNYNGMNIGLHSLGVQNTSQVVNMEIDSMGVRNTHQGVDVGMDFAGRGRGRLLVKDFEAGIGRGRIRKI